MSVIWMDNDVALAEVPVNSVPLTNDTDFKSLETGVAYNAAGLALYWHFVTTAGVYTVTQVTPTSGGDYNWAHQAQAMYTISIPESGGASINNDAEGFGYFTGVATGVLPWRGPTIGFRAAGKNDLLVDGAHSATRGLAGTALPDAAAGSNGGLLRIGTNTGHVEITDGIEIGRTTAGGDAVRIIGGDGDDGTETPGGRGIYVEGGQEDGVAIGGAGVVIRAAAIAAVNLIGIDSAPALRVDADDNSAVEITSLLKTAVAIQGETAVRFSGNDGPAVRLEVFGSGDALSIAGGDTSGDAIHLEVTDGRIGVAQGIRRGVDFDNFDFPMYDAQGNLAPGLTVDAVVRLDNGTFVPCANAVSEVGGGIYTIDLDGDADLDARKVTLLFTDADSDSNIRPTMIQVVLEQ